MAREFGKLTLTIVQAELAQIIADGRIVDFTNSLSELASEQIPAQVVDHLVQATAAGEEGGTVVEFALVVSDGGSYGTKPHLRIKSVIPQPTDFP